MESKSSGGVVGGMKRTASGIWRRNVSTSNLSLASNESPTPKVLNLQKLTLNERTSSCPDLIPLQPQLQPTLSPEKERKMMRLERNRNAARLRRHKRRLEVMVLAKEKVDLESAKIFLSKLKFIEQRDFTQVFGYPTREVLTRIERSSNSSPLKKQVSVPDLNFGHYTGNQDYFGTECQGHGS